MSTCKASCVDRFGRNPNEQSTISASKTGSITIFTAACTIRSPTITARSDVNLDCYDVPIDGFDLSVYLSGGEMTLPNIQIGILPLRDQAKPSILRDFISTPTAPTMPTRWLSSSLLPTISPISEPTSVALYLREFDRLRAGATYGDPSRALLDQIMADLQTEK
jgi:hypothetical protein